MTCRAVGRSDSGASCTGTVASRCAAVVPRMMEAPVEDGPGLNQVLARRRIPRSVDGSDFRRIQQPWMTDDHAANYRDRRLVVAGLRQARTRSGLIHWVYA